MNTLDNIPSQIAALLTTATTTAGNPLNGLKVVRLEWNKEAPDATVQSEMTDGTGVVIFVGQVRERRVQNTPIDGSFEGVAAVDVMILVNDRRNTSGGVNRNPMDLVYAVRKAVIGRRSAGSFLLGQASLTIEEIGGGTMYAQEFETFTQWQP